MFKSYWWLLVFLVSWLETQPILIYLEDDEPYYKVRTYQILATKEDAFSFAWRVSKTPGTSEVSVYEIGKENIWKNPRPGGEKEEG